MQNTAPLGGRQLLAPALTVFALAAAMVYAVAFDQGPLATLATDAARDSGGALHELFHDARHLLGVPCH